MDPLGVDAVAMWARSGAMALTGHPEGPPLVLPGPAVVATRALTSLGLELSSLLSERAAIAGLSRAGSTSCGAATRLLEAEDGSFALTLARPEDVELLPALICRDVVDPWRDVTSWARRRPVAEVLDRCALLGLPVGAMGEADGPPVLESCSRPGTPPAHQPLVIDLSALWAGPLCTSLLGRLGCRVVKVESTQRPDGARRGPAAFFDLLNAGKETLVLDFRRDVEVLRDLLLSADVVVESSRPRALRQLGIEAEDIVGASTLTWVSITGHGRESDRVGFGDDAAVAGGLVVDGCFVADAVADPLTGVVAAAAAWEAVQSGGARLLDIALSRVAGAAAAVPRDDRRAVLWAGTWWVESESELVAVAEPWARAA